MAEYETSLISLGDEFLGLLDTERSDPLHILRVWLENARSLSIPEPEVIALATSNSEGRPSVRMMNVLDIDAHRIFFASHAGSRKGQEISETGHAAGVFYWRETKQQVHFVGPASQSSAEVSNRFWNKRPLHVSAMSAVAEQSAGLRDANQLRQAAKDLIAKAIPLTRPKGWTAYEVEPDRIEFWIAGTDRLHTRVEFHARESGWARELLQP